jgi:hypothetical protein
MKKLFFALLIILFSTTAFAASSVVETASAQDNGDVLVKLVCTAHTDGTFSDYILTTGSIKGKRIVHAWAVNHNATYPASGAVSISDTTGQQLVGTTAGDSLTLSTAANGYAPLSIGRVSKQRSVVSRLVLSVSTTTTNSAQFTLYILFS